MSILAVGGEDSDFLIVGASNAAVTTAGKFRANYARCALRVAASYSNAAGFFFKFPASYASFWMSVQYNIANGTIFPNSDTVMGFRKDNVERLVLRIRYTGSGSGGQTYGIFKVNSVGALTLLAETTTLFPLSFSTKLDWQVDYGVAGSIKVYSDGVLFLSYTGDTTTDGVTSLDQARLGSGHGQDICWSELILADEDTRNLSLVRLTPLAAGNTQEWSGGVADVNEIVLNDSTIITSPEADKTAQFTVTPGAVIAGNLGIRSLHINARATKGTEGPQNLKASVRVTGTDFESAAVTPASVYERVGWSFPLNPKTAVPWTAGDLTVGGFNVGIKTAA